MGMCPDGNCPECQKSRAKVAEMIRNAGTQFQQVLNQDRQKFLKRFDAKFLADRPGIRWATEKAK